MKKIITLSLAFATLLAANAADKVITLDLTKSTTPLEFNKETGAWNGTYNDDEESIESQCFSFAKSSYGEYQTWWGITASNSADNSPRAEYVTYQFSNMAAGGIVLNEDGTVKKNEFGQPVTSGTVPYLVCFGGPSWGPDAINMVFNDGKTYEPVGVYVNLNSYTFFSNIYGSTPARPFTNGDKYTLTINGVVADESKKSVDVVLSSFDEGYLKQAKGWVYVDLSSLGTVNQLTFTLSTTDTGQYGENTPCYFCMDKLMVKESQASIANIANDDNSISYDRNTKMVTLAKEGFIMVCNTAGQTVMSAESTQLDLSGLEHGVYVVKSGNQSIKILR